jgi:cell division protein FtsB
MSAPRKLALLAAAAAAGLALLSLSDARGVRRATMLKADVTSYRQRNRTLFVENAQLRREIEALSGDLKALERAAREDLGLVRSNEVVFTFEK